MNLLLTCFRHVSWGGKAFAAEQKIREFKKTLLRSKRLEKDRGKRIKPNDLIKKAAKNMNETISTKYQLAPEATEKKEVQIQTTGNIFKKYMTLWDFEKSKIIKQETINKIKNFIEQKEN